MTAISERLKTLPGTAGLLPGVLLASCVGVLLYVATARVIERDAEARFTNYAFGAQKAIQARIVAYTNVLRGAAALFHASEDVSRAAFHDYVAGLDLPRNFPAIQAINYAEYVRDADMPAFERAMRRDAAAAGKSPDLYQLRPPGRRADYCVLKYVEPGNSWWETFGMDLAVQPQARQVLAEARDTGRLITSGRPVAAISSPNRIGLAMRLPLYRPGAPLDSVAQRRAAYRGSLGIAFSVHTLLSGVLDEMPIRPVRMTLVDPDYAWPDGRIGQTLFDSAGTHRLPAPPLLGADDGVSIEVPVDFNGHHWTARFSARHATMQSESDRYFPWIALASGFISTLLLCALFFTMSRSRRNALSLAQSMTRDLRESQAALQASHATLRKLAAHGEQIKENERKRIAREIHDDLGQNLLALRIEADILCARTGARQPRLHARARATRAQIDSTIQSVRNIINDLRPHVLDLGLAAALEWQVVEFERRSGVLCELDTSAGEIGIIDDACATAFFRILQESLHNVARHAKATYVRVELTARHGYLNMTIRDNGAGFDPGLRSRTGAFGLIGIAERAKMLGGWSSVVSAPACGTTVSISVPLHRPDALPDGGTALVTEAASTWRAPPPAVPAVSGDISH